MPRPIRKGCPRTAWISFPRPPSPCGENENGERLGRPPRKSGSRGSARRKWSGCLLRPVDQPSQALEPVQDQMKLRGIVGHERHEEVTLRRHGPLRLQPSNNDSGCVQKLPEDTIHDHRGGVVAIDELIARFGPARLDPIGRGDFTVRFGTGGRLRATARCPQPQRVAQAGWAVSATRSVSE